MSTKSVVAALVIAVASLTAAAGCAEPVDEGETDNAVTVAASPLVTGMADDGPAPGPLDRPGPKLGPKMVDRPTPGQPTGDGVVDMWEPKPVTFGGCAIVTYTIWDPARGKAIEIPVTQCD